jgi:quercetin dioxygenase-like cupin family protein
LTIEPHTALPWHTHPFPDDVYVLSGSLTLHDKASGKTQVVHQGQAVGESVDDVHRGESGDEPTVLLITYVGTPGIPTDPRPRAVSLHHRAQAPDAGGNVGAVPNTV